MTDWKQIRYIYKHTTYINNVNRIEYSIPLGSFFRVRRDIYEYNFTTVNEIEVNISAITKVEFLRYDMIQDIYDTRSDELLDIFQSPVRVTVQLNEYAYDYGCTLRVEIFNQTARIIVEDPDEFVDRV